MNEFSLDRLRHHKYRIVTSRIPSSNSKSLAHRILVSGKSINFLREVCEDKTPIKGRGFFKLGSDFKLHELIDQVCSNTSQIVLEIALGQYSLMEQLFSMRKYLPLGQGDFIGMLMENLKDELDRPAIDLYLHSLFSIVASSIRAPSPQGNINQLILISFNEFLNLADETKNLQHSHGIFQGYTIRGTS